MLSFARFKATADLQRASGPKKGGSKILNIPKLDDANFAGGSKGQHCTLILTEGDSAKSLAIAGLSVIGRDYFGVFPLKGKLLNVREATIAAIKANTEIQNIVQIMGLQYGKVYESTAGLRYGHLMIMADQDHDGSHIKGLVLNFLHNFWPSLLAIPGFLREFITPIVKAVKGKSSKTFFTLPEYQNWKNALMEGSAGSKGGAISGLRGWNIKYYKGLGTSTSVEAKEYFAAIDSHQIDFAMDVPEETGHNANDLIDLAFSKKRADDRKEWLKGFEPGTHMSYGTEGAKGMQQLLVSDFIHKELILFSMADNVRSIPSMVDGLKPAQRKVLFACFKRNLKADVKVAQLAGYVSEHASYHHGEAALAATIVGMAQNFVGSNNLNLLVPSGQFGTRLMGGKDAASARYIFTRLTAVARAVFHPDDDALLNYQDDDGQMIEPDHYVPVIPLVLVNGADGIGTGWSTFVPNYNPRDIIAALRSRISGDTIPDIKPWYYGFSGSIAPKDAACSAYVTNGVAEVDATGTVLTISELPIGKWTQDYKAMLVEMITGQKDKDEKGGKEGGAKVKAKKLAAAASSKGKPAAPAKGGKAAAKGQENLAPDASGASKARAAKDKKPARVVNMDDEEDEFSVDEMEDDEDFESEEEEEEDEEDDDFSDEDDKKRKKKKGGKPKSEKTSEKDAIAALVPAGEPLVKDFAENHTDKTVSFTINLTPAAAKLVASSAGAGPAGLSPLVSRVFKLDSSISTVNMHLFDSNGMIKRYTSPAEIIEEFYTLRLATYEKRKAHLMAQLSEEVDRLSNRARFILAVINGTLIIGNRKKADLLAELHDAGYKGFAPTSADGAEDEAGNDGAEDPMTVGKAGTDISLQTLSRRYHYLLSMPIWSLTMEKVTQLRAELAEKEAALLKLRSTAPGTMWLNDLAVLEQTLVGFDADNALDDEQEEKARKAFSKSKAGGGKGTKAAKGGAGSKSKASKAKFADSDDDMDGLDDSADDFDDDEDEDYDSDYKKKSKKKAAAPAKTVAAPAKKAAAPAKPATAASAKAAAPALAVASTTAAASSSFASSLSSFAAPAPAPAPAPVAVSVIKDDSDDDFIGMSLAQRLALKMNLSAAPVTSTAPSMTVAFAQASTASSATAAKPKAPAAKAAAAAKPAAAVKAPTAPAPAAEEDVSVRPKRAAAKAVTYVVDSDDEEDAEDDDDDFGDSEDDEIDLGKLKKSKSSSATTAAKPGVKRGKSDERAGVSSSAAATFGSPMKGSPKAKRKPKAAAATGAATKKAASTAAAASTSSRPARAAASKVVYKDDSEDEDSVSEIDDDDDDDWN